MAGGILALECASKSASNAAYHRNFLSLLANLARRDACTHQVSNLKRRVYVPACTKFTTNSQPICTSCESALAAYMNVAQRAAPCRMSTQASGLCRKLPQYDFWQRFNFSFLFEKTRVRPSVQISEKTCVRPSVHEIPE